MLKLLLKRIGSGPFKLVDWRQREQVILRKLHHLIHRKHRWIMKEIPKAKILGQFRKAEVNSLTDYKD